MNYTNTKEINIMIHKNSKMMELESPLYLILDFKKEDLLNFYNEYKKELDLCNDDNERDAIICKWKSIFDEYPTFPVINKDIKIVTRSNDFNVYVISNIFDYTTSFVISNEINIHDSIQLDIFKNMIENNCELKLLENDIKYFIDEDDVREYNYECFNFIPYRQIGPFILNKEMLESDFKSQGIKYLYEDSINHVQNRTITLDNPENIKRNMIDKVYLKCNNTIVRLTCQTDKLINNLNRICNDLVQKNKGEYIEFYSKSLGIIGYANKFNDDYYTQYITFSNEEIFNKKIDEMNIDI